MAARNRLLFFDTETTGLPKRMEAPTSHLANWPRVVQLAWILTDDGGREISHGSYLIRPRGWRMQAGAQRCHGITVQQAKKEGVPLGIVMRRFATDLLQTDTVIGHNVMFDHRIVGAEFFRLGQGNPLLKRHVQCTMKMGQGFLARRKADPSDSPAHLRQRRSGPVPPSLDRLHRALFDRPVTGAHDALVDARACMACYFEMRRQTQPRHPLWESSEAPSGSHPPATAGELRCATP